MPVELLDDSINILANGKTFEVELPKSTIDVDGVNTEAKWHYHATKPHMHFISNVGIGTLANTTDKLCINGILNVVGNYKINNTILDLSNLFYWNSNNSNISNIKIYNLNSNIGIGTTNPQYELHVEGNIYADQGGSTSNGSTSWAITSDSRIKENIYKASYKECYEIFKKIELYRFNYKHGYVKSNDKNQLGFIAQDIQEYLPDSVNKKGFKLSDNTYIDDFMTLNIAQINYILYGAFKYLIKELEIIKNHI